MADYPDVSEAMEDDQSESSSSGDDSNDDSTAVDEDAIARLEEALSTNQYLYDSHVALIAELRKGIGKPDAFYKLRQARERMRKLFPLSEDLWLQWIGDETLFNSTAVDKDFVKGLYDSAVSDYLSVRVWLEYCKFTMGTMVDGLATLDDVRSVFERALMSCGLHVSQGSTLWEAFREFEITILDSVNELSKDENDKDVKLQMDRVANIFKRQLSVPLIGMEATANEFTKWAEEHNVVVSNYTQSYKKALSTLGKCIEYEDRLKQAESPRLEQYKEYIQFEMSAADPARIQCIYERALAENCLHASLWMDYTHFLDTKLKIKDVSLVAHQRAVRNCPWISQLWCSWIRAMERNAVDLMSVKEMFEEGLRCGFSSADDYISLWSAFIDYQWRRRDSVDDKEEIISTVRETFQKAVEHVKQLYGQKADHSCSLKRHWAALEATHFNSIARARELWEEVMSEGHRRSVSMWLEYAELERRCGSVTQTRKLLHEAVVRGSDEPQRAYEALLKFEREEGTLSEWESAWERCQVKVKQITEQRAKMEAVVEEKKKAGKKREDGERKKRKKEIDDDSSAAKRSRGDAEEEMEKAKKTVVRCDDERTVFVSNLQFSTTEDELRQAFSSCGDVTIINVVKDTKWKMKNYAYVEFSLPSAIDAALALDRTLLSGRPMFVSRYGQGGQHRSKPKYPITPDKNTVFVSNLAFGATPEEVKEIFTQCGVVKEVRKTCDALGRPKGFAFVEYEESKSARDAVTVLEGYRLRGRPIKVAISNPPQKSLISKRGGMTGNNMGQRGHVDSEGFAIPLNPGIRTSSRTQISLVPRSVKQKKENETSNGEPIKPSQRLSNKDFRNLLLKK